MTTNHLGGVAWSYFILWIVLAFLNDLTQSRCSLFRGCTIDESFGEGTHRLWVADLWWSRCHLIEALFDVQSRKISVIAIVKARKSTNPRWPNEEEQHETRHRLNFLLEPGVVSEAFRRAEAPWMLSLLENTNEEITEATNRLPLLEQGIFILFPQGENSLDLHVKDMGERRSPSLWRELPTFDVRFPNPHHFMVHEAEH